MRRRAVLLGLAALPLAACAPAVSIRAPEEELALRRAPNPGPPALSLITVRNERNGSGEHSALLIAASERAMFDPWGGWRDPYVPEQDDVLFGLTDAALERYLRYQADDGFFYVAQEKRVPPQVAETALARARAHGPVGQSLCTRAVGTVLEGLPGFEPLGRPWMPDTLARRFARLPGVTTTERHGPSYDQSASSASPA